jgi:hypothetical protein
LNLLMTPPTLRNTFSFRKLANSHWNEMVNRATIGEVQCAKAIK